MNFCQLAELLVYIGHGLHSVKGCDGDHPGFKIMEIISAEVRRWHVLNSVPSLDWNA